MRLSFLAFSELSRCRSRDLFEDSVEIGQITEPTFGRNIKNGFVGLTKHGLCQLYAFDVDIIPRRNAV